MCDENIKSPQPYTTPWGTAESYKSNECDTVDVITNKPECKEVEKFTN